LICCPVCRNPNTAPRNARSPRTAMPPRSGHCRRSCARSVRKSPFCTSDLHNFWASKLHAHLVCGPYANELRRYCHSAVPLQPPAASTQDAGRRTRAGPQDSGVRACRHAVNKAPSTVPVINPCLCGISLFPSHFHFRLHPSSFGSFAMRVSLCKWECILALPFIFAKWKSYANFLGCEKLLPPRDTGSAWSPL